ncbi:MAG: F0F1 ATP synthase subunit A [Puniceicoccales bacterium]|nr:F0F1 ATP synthase subunit A [Puniceicoccales bacterium]
MFLKIKGGWLIAFCIFSLLGGFCNLHAESAVSPKAYVLFSVGSFPITNGMLYTWLVSLVIIAVVRCAVGRPQLIPGRGQMVVEGVIDNLYQMVVPIVGRKAAKATFPLLIGFFIYILMHNWSSLLPGVTTIGAYQHNHFLYFFRPANADLNAPLALAIVSFTAWLYCILRFTGIKGSIVHLFGNKADRNEVSLGIYSFLFFIFLGVGFIECISILFRLVSLSFRLYGNVFGGENLINNIMTLSPWTKLIIPIPFYFLEILIGAIQAFVFTLLTAVYIGLMCNHEEEA